MEHKILIINQLQTTDYQSVKKKRHVVAQKQKKSYLFRALNALVFLRPKNLVRFSTQNSKIKLMPLFLIGILGGTLLSSAIKALFNIGGTITQNQYNSPQAQIRRLRKAGLPLSYMYQGKVATQSETPKLDLEPTLGTLPKLQGEKLQADTSGKLIENSIQSGIDAWNKKSSPEPGLTNQEYNLDSDQGTKNAESFIKKHEQELKQIEVWLENNAYAEGIQMDQRREALKKAAQQVKNLIAQEGLMTQLQKIRGYEELLNTKTMESLDSLPKWAETIATLLLKLFHTKNFN